MALSDEQRTRWAFGAAAAGLVAPVAYLAQRLIALQLGEGVDPTLIVRESHTAFYWRSALSAWVGVAVFVIVAALGRGEPSPRVVRALRLVLFPSGALLALLFWRFP